MYALSCDYFSRGRAARHSVHLQDASGEMRRVVEEIEIEIMLVGQ